LFLAFLPLQSFFLAFLLLDFVLELGEEHVYFIFPLLVLSLDLPLCSLNLDVFPQASYSSSLYPEVTLFDGSVGLDQFDLSLSLVLDLLPLKLERAHMSQPQFKDLIPLAIRDMLL